MTVQQSNLTRSLHTPDSRSWEPSSVKEMLVYTNATQLTMENALISTDYAMLHQCREKRRFPPLCRVASSSARWPAKYKTAFSFRTALMYRISLASSISTANQHPPFSKQFAKQARHLASTSSSGGLLCLQKYRPSSIKCFLIVYLTLAGLINQSPGLQSPKLQPLELQLP